MYFTIIIAAFIAFLRTASASIDLFPGHDLTKREWRGNNVTVYLLHMCFPLVSNGTHRVMALANSPFPCELMNYFLYACSANGTSAIDFVAEQQCLCNGGAFWDLMEGCNDCFLSHGDNRNSSSAWAEHVSSVKAAECSVATPCQPFSMLLPPMPEMGATTRWVDPYPNRTLGNDRFPNDTAASNYFTPTRSLTLGEITGSATARVTKFTNSHGISFVPTCTAEAVTEVSDTTSQDTSSSTSNSPSASVSGNLAVVAAAEVYVVKIAVAVVLGAAVWL